MHLRTLPCLALPPQALERVQEQLSQAQPVGPIASLQLPDDAAPLLDVTRQGVVLRPLDAHERASPATSLALTHLAEGLARLKAEPCPVLEVRGAGCGGERGAGGEVPRWRWRGDVGHAGHCASARRACLWQSGPHLHNSRLALPPPVPTQAHPDLMCCPPPSPPPHLPPRPLAPRSALATCSGA